MKRFFLLAVCLFLLPCSTLAASLQAERLSQRLTELLPRGARWGVTALDLKSGREIIVAGNANELFAPASLVKLITAATALELERDGKPVVLATEILHDGRRSGSTLDGNIYLRGNANCLLTANDLKQAAQMLRGKGITTITGSVVADATRFDARGLERTRKGTGYAPVSALGMDLHTVSVSVAPAGPGRPPHITVEPPNSGVRFAVAARTVNGGKNSLAVSKNDDYGYQINGAIAGDSGIQHWRFSLANPARYTAQSFRTILVQAGIQVQGEAITGRTPGDATMLATIPGPSMAHFVRGMNIHSLNVAADNLLLAIGSITSGLPGTRDKGVAALKDNLTRHGISSGEARIVDGSGLLPGNRISTNALARYLTTASHQPWFGDLRDSLPRPGMDGTLRSGTYGNERFRAKSGNLENVTALAGYGVDTSGREIAFAFIAESPTMLPPNAREAGNAVMRYLAE